LTGFNRYAKSSRDAQLACELEGRDRQQLLFALRLREQPHTSPEDRPRLSNATPRLSNASALGARVFIGADTGF